MQTLRRGVALRVLVTGASGFVGRQTIGALARAGVEVHAHAQHAEKVDGAVVAYGGDLRAPGAAGALINRVRPDTVLHLAWNVEHGAFWTNRDNLDWTAATLLLARAALDAGVQRFVGVGTCFEYRWPDDGTCNEGATEIAPQTLYAVAKDAARRVLQELGDISFAWARLFYLYGPFEHEARLVASLAAKLARGEAAPLSRGLAVRDFLDTRDAGAALAALVLSETTGAVNIASGEGVSVASIAERLGAIAGRSDLIRVGALPDRPDEPPRIVADVRRLRDEVGFRPSRTLDEGLAETYAWWRAELGGRP